ncbi:hypothetical protein ACHAWX_007410 [Stephanocyclus meneghinianus]
MMNSNTTGHDKQHQLFYSVKNYRKRSMPRPLCLVLALYSSLSVESNTLRGGHQPHGINGDIVQRGHSRKNVNIVGGRGSDRRLLQRIAAMEDATLRSSTPYTNYGHDDDLQFVPSATSPNPNDEADTLIKFDLSLLRGDSATGNSGDQAYYLHLYTSEHCDFASNPMASQLGLLSVGVAENVVSNNVVGSDVNALWEWNEESVTWYNAPSWKQGSEKIVKPLGELEGRAWLEIDITSLVASTTAPILTLRLSSVLYAYSDDNYSLCTFASRDYRRGMYSPRLVMQTQDSNESDAKPIKMLSTTLIEQRQEGEDTRQDFDSIPHKVFPPKILSETATTTKVTSCAAPYSPLQIYAHGDVVSNDHKNYKCKPYPYTDWCNSDKYEPGVSMHWALAWDLVNDCKTDIQSIHQKDGALDTSFKEPTTFSYSVQDADAEPSAGSPLCPARWNSDYPYRSGDRVTLPSTLTIYECKEEPFGNVCADQAYEVGVEGGVFLNAWKAVGTCVNGRVVENDSTEDISSNFVQALPSTPQADPMSYEIPTKCNLCRPGQIGINADIDFNGKAMKCMDIYEFYLQNHLEVSKQCIAAQGWLNGICCGDESAMNLEGALATTSSTTSASTAIFTTAALVSDVSFIPNRLPRPTTPESTTPPPSPGLAQDVHETIVGSPPSLPADNSEEAFVVPNCATPYSKDDNSYYLNKRVSQSEGNYVCMMAHWCSMPDFEPAVGKYWMVVWEYEGPCIDSGTESSNARPVRPTGNISTSVPDADSFVLADEQTNPPSDALADSFIFETTSSPTPPSTQKPTDLVAGDPEVSVSNSGEPLPRPTDLEDSEAAVSVNGSDESECPEPWRLDFAYVEGDQVAVQGQIYTCKEFPYTGWCGLDGYEPTVGSYWDMAWNVGDNCLGQGSQSSLPSPTTNAQVTSTTTIDPSTPASLPAPTTNAQVTATTTINPSTPASSTTNSPVTSTTTVDPSTPASDVEDYDEDGAPANNTVPITKDMGTGEKVFAILEEKKDAIDNTIFLYQGSEPSTVYRYDGFVAGLRVMFESGVAGKYYYLGDSSENGYKYGLVNLAG